jgi:hypothetical protein
MKLDQFHVDDSEIDWYWVGETLMVVKYIRHKDLLPGDYRYDNIRLGYWIKSPSPTATILALKGCEFSIKFGQTEW